MKTRRVFVPLALLVAAALACVPSLPSSTALYRDNFSSSDSGWCVDSSASSSTDYSGGEYVVKVLQKNWLVWCNPGQNFGDIHVEVTTKNAGSTSDSYFGVICNDQKNEAAKTESFYYLGLSSDGHYTISLSQNGTDKVLAEDMSTAIATNAVSYTVGADCGGGHLALYVDGAKIASASDSTFTTGDVGLFAWTGEKSPAEIHFDDIVVTKLSSPTPTP